MESGWRGPGGPASGGKVWAGDMDEGETGSWGKWEACGVGGKGPTPGAGGAEIRSRLLCARHHPEPLCYLIKILPTDPSRGTMTILTSHPSRQRDVPAAPAARAGIDPGPKPGLGMHGESLRAAWV